jgi:hypothetical protein
VKLYKIFVGQNIITFHFDCPHCGEDSFVKISKTDMEHFFSLYLEGKEIGDDWRLFMLGIYYRNLFDNDVHHRDFKIYLLELLNKYKNKVIVRRGKKIMIKSFGVEKILNDNRLQTM